MKVRVGILGGLLVGALASLMLSLAFAPSITKGGSHVGVYAFFIGWIASIVVAVRAPSAVKALRRILLTAAVMAFVLPLAGLVFTGSVVTDVASTGANSGARAAGAVIGGGLVSGFLGFVGFFLGVVCLLIGLLIGRDKQVVYVDRTASTG